MARLLFPHVPFPDGLRDKVASTANGAFLTLLIT
jgi:hypothetical protein